MSENTNILVVGIGGQGVMTATEILAEAAIALGHDVKKTEVAGMAQRGGVVSSHLRFGTRVLTPQITPGTADVLLGFESAEAMRWQHMGRDGAAALPHEVLLFTRRHQVSAPLHLPHHRESGVFGDLEGFERIGNEKQVHDRSG